MNYYFVLRQFGVLMLLVSAVLTVVSAWATWNWYGGDVDEWYAVEAMMLTVILGGTLGGLLWWFTRRSDDFLGRREALLLVAAGWIGGAALAGLPYWLWALLDPHARHMDGGPHEFASFIDCYFEAMSGLTTTGATILNAIEDVPASLLLWRATTHWLGGLGIVVLFVAVLPNLGVGGKKLFNLEVPGPKSGGVRPRIRETARAMWLIYLTITCAAIFSLRASGQMSWFDSVCHAFSMVSTGGLSTRDASIGAYDSTLVDVICILFMLLAGVNFGLFYALSQGRWRTVWKDVELRVYLILKVAVILIVTLNILGMPIITTAAKTIDATVFQALRYAGFQTVALHTGTGYCTADYETWPFLSKALLIGLMFIGGCAGSTAGGIKVIRFWIGLKVLAAQLEYLFRPNVVRPVKIGRGVLDSDQKLAAVSYFLLIILLFGAGTFLVMFLETTLAPGGGCDFQTAMSATVSTLCNVGPGLHGVGATENYSWFTGPSKLVLSLLMMLGRLEVFSIFVLLLPSFWKGD